VHDIEREHEVVGTRLDLGGIAGLEAGVVEAEPLGLGGGGGDARRREVVAAMRLAG
jgi:hypothetical protein